MASFSDTVTAWEQTEVELLSEEGDRAVVLLTVPDEEPIEMPMVRIEGRWIPTELADQWPAAVTDARTKIEMLGSDEAAQIRVQVLFGIGIVEGFIDQIDEMETTDEFDDLARRRPRQHHGDPGRPRCHDRRLIRDPSRIELRVAGPTTLSAEPRMRTVDLDRVVSDPAFESAV